MANSMATLSRRLYRSLLYHPRFSQSLRSLCTNNNVDELSSSISDTESPHEPNASDPNHRFSGEDRVMEEGPLENGLDAGIFKVLSFVEMVVYLEFECC